MLIVPVCGADGGRGRFSSALPGRDFGIVDLEIVRQTIMRDWARGHSAIARSEEWNWQQANGAFKEYAARDLLLRVEEAGAVATAAAPKVNHKAVDFREVPLFVDRSPGGAGAGEGIVGYRRGGFGRTVVAARRLVEFGEAPERALARVRCVRAGTVEIRHQEDYVRGLVQVQGIL